MRWLTKYLDSSPRLRPYYLMWLRGTTKTINKWPEDKFIKGVMDCYERHCGYRFDLNNPKLFNEKLQWYKVYYKHPDIERITDKVTFKDYIKERIGDGYTIPMLGYWTSADDLINEWNNLPNKFVLKSNMMANASGVIVIHDKKVINLRELKKTVKTWLNPFNTLNNSWDCRFYSGAPKILAEQYMEDEYGELRDYKFFCFNGKVDCFAIHYGRMAVHHAKYFNREFKELEGISHYAKDDSIEVPIPEKIDEMVAIAEELSKEFPFVRVDFYYVNKKVLLSELTFAPGGGVLPYSQTVNERWGKMLMLPIHK